MNQLDNSFTSIDIAFIDKSPQTSHSIDNIKSEGALRRSHAITVAMLEHANARIREAEREINAQSRRIRQLEGLAVTDELTGLLNRRGFENSVKKELDRLHRAQATGGIFALFDLNDFKPINDTYGHFAGDLCLKSFATCLKNMIRTTDVAGRIGGDEFALYLGNIDPVKAVKKLAEINAALNDLSVTWDGQIIKISVSVGFVPLDVPPPTYDELYIIADRRMYRNKTLQQDQEGQRNKILDATNVLMDGLH